MTIFLVVVHVIVSLVLILVILLQTGKGGGLSEAFGGASQQLFGTKSSAFLNRATAVCAFLFLVTSLSLGVLSGHGRRSLMDTAPSRSAPAGISETAPPVPDVTQTDEEVPAPDEPSPRDQESTSLPSL